MAKMNLRANTPKEEYEKKAKFIESKGFTKEATMIRHFATESNYAYADFIFNEYRHLSPQVDMHRLLEEAALEEELNYVHF